MPHVRRSYFFMLGLAVGLTYAAASLAGCGTDQAASPGAGTDGGGTADAAADGPAMTADGSRLGDASMDGGGGPRDSIGFAQLSSSMLAFHLRTTTASPGEVTATLTSSGVVPIVGDWDGDGVDTIGSYSPTTSTFFLRNSNTDGSPTITVAFGVPGVESLPVRGDWTKSGKDAVGMYDPTTGSFHLQIGGTDKTFLFSASDAGVFFPLAGDWDGDGIDTVGLYGFSEGSFFLKNSNDANPATNIPVFTFGAGGGIPIAGDWNGKGSDSVGFFVAPEFSLRNSNSAGPADFTISYGISGSTALAGRWTK